MTTQAQVVTMVDIIPDAFDYINAAVSLITISLSLLAIFLTIKENKTSFEISIYNMLQEAKTNMDNNIAQLPKPRFWNKKDNELAVSAYIENYLNALNTACAMYNSGELNKKRFNTLFLDDISKLSRDSIFREYLYTDNDAYPHLKTYIKENVK